MPELIQIVYGIIKKKIRDLSNLQIQIFFKSIELSQILNLEFDDKLIASLSPNFKSKICQKFKFSQPKLINYHLLNNDFSLANF